MNREKQRVLNYLIKPRMCNRKNCRLEFREIANLGRHECNYYHPLASSIDCNGRMACCRRIPGSVGCVPADHTDGTNNGDKVVQFAEELYVQVTSDQALLMASQTKQELSAVKTPAWKLDEQTCMWNVARCDVTARMTRINTAVY